MPRLKDRRFEAYLPSDLSPAARSYRYEREVQKTIRKTLDEITDAKTAGGMRKMTKLDAFQENLKADCLRGNTNALRIQKKIQDILRSKDAFAPRDSRAEPAQFESWPERLEREERDDAITTIAHTRAIADLAVRYIAIYGEKPSFEFKLLPIADPEPARAALDAIYKEHDKQVATEAGGENPSVATRFQKGRSGNPTGKRKEASDGWDILRSGLDPVTVLKKGRRKKLAGVAVTCTRVLERAIAGDPASRREVVEYLSELDRWGMMSRPTKPKRRRRPSAEQKAYDAVIDAHLNMLSLTLWQQMWENVVQVFDSETLLYYEAVRKSRMTALTRAKIRLYFARIASKRSSESKPIAIAPMPDS